MKRAFTSTTEPDRHTLQGLQKGYSIEENLEFKRILKHYTNPRRKYHRRQHETKTVCHWGQRKLMLSEIEFLTQNCSKDANVKNVVVYAGAAPGTHVPFLAEMFKDAVHKFILVDPRPLEKDLKSGDWKKRFNFNITTNSSTSSNSKCSKIPQMDMRQEFFTDEMAREIRTQHPESENYRVLFISDIRTSSDDDDNTTEKNSNKKPNTVDPNQVHNSSIVEKNLNISNANSTNPNDLSVKTAPNDEVVETDMDLQLRWHKIMRPFASSFKFRLAWEDGKTRYLKGDVTFPVWGPVTTTETRLFAYGKDLEDETENSDNKSMMDYDNRTYEEQLFYFNTHLRIAKYNNKFNDYYKCRCYDCTAEGILLENYIAKFGNDSYSFLSTDVGNSTNIGNSSLLDKVKELSLRLDRECHRDRTNPRTLFDPNIDPGERKQRIRKRQKVDVKQ